MTLSDLDLLRDYQQTRSDDAFAELVRRHLNLVYSAALRQVRSPQLAEEVAQSTFTDLACNAHRLAPDTILTAWLYQVSQRTAIDVVRRESRRQLREQIATEMNRMNATDADWKHIEPLLDEAMLALDDTDRAAVLLRYFENQSLREVGAALGTSDDAAQKRVSRALERLREFFAKRGVTVGATGIAVVISANAVQAAPTGLAVTIATAAGIAGTTITATATATTVLAMTTLQKTVIALAFLAAVGTGTYEARRASNLRDANELLQQQQAGLASQIGQLQNENKDASNRLASLMGTLAEQKRNMAELLKLRAEVTRLGQITGTNQESVDPMESAARDWSKKVGRLKAKFDEWPDKKIPELQFLSDYDWLQRARTPLDNLSENTWRHLLAELRLTAKMNFGHIMGDALENFIADHDGQLPLELSQLNHYYKSDSGQIAELDPSLWTRYELVQTGNLANIPYTEPLITEKTVPVDADYDTHFTFTAYSFHYDGIDEQGNGPFNHSDKIRKYRKE
jgi:RNA polymerase sigma factor (sigma-70 family)